MNTLKFCVYFPKHKLYLGRIIYRGNLVDMLFKLDRAKIFGSKWEAIEAGSATGKVFIVQEIYVP